MVLHEAGVPDVGVDVPANRQFPRLGGQNKQCFHSPGGGHAHATLALLDNDGQDEAVVNLGFLGDCLNGIVDGTDLVTRVVGTLEKLARFMRLLYLTLSYPVVPDAAVGQDLLVVVEHVLERNPLLLCRPSGLERAVTLVQLVGVRAAANAVLVVDGGNSGTTRDHAAGGAGKEMGREPGL